MALQGFGALNFMRHSGALITTTPLSMACWFYPLYVNQLRYLGGIYNSASANQRNWFTLGTSSAGGVQAATADAATGAAGAVSSAAHVQDQWQHACGVFASASDRRAYLDGGSKVTNTTTLTPSGLNRTSVGVQDNTAPSGSATFGYVAEFAIWDVALTDQEVGILATGIVPLMVRPQNLIAYWPLIGRHLPNEINLMSNASPLVQVGTVSRRRHPRILMPSRPRLYLP